jgi:hypothetical protein
MWRCPTLRSSLSCRTTGASSPSSSPTATTTPPRSTGEPHLICRRVRWECRRSVHPARHMRGASMNHLTKSFSISGHCWLIVGHVTLCCVCAHYAPEHARAASGRASAPCPTVLAQRPWASASRVTRHNGGRSRAIFGRGRGRSCSVVSWAIWPLSAQWPGTLFNSLFNF